MKTSQIQIPIWFCILVLSAFYTPGLHADIASQLERIPSEKLPIIRELRPKAIVNKKGDTGAFMETGLLGKFENVLSYGSESNRKNLALVTKSYDPNKEVLILFDSNWNTLDRLEIEGDIDQSSFDKYTIDGDSKGLKFTWHTSNLGSGGAWSSKHITKLLLSEKLKILDHYKISSSSPTSVRKNFLDISIEKEGIKDKPLKVALLLLNRAPRSLGTYKISKTLEIANLLLREKHYEEAKTLIKQAYDEAPRQASGLVTRAKEMQLILPQVSDTEIISQLEYYSNSYHYRDKPEAKLNKMTGLLQHHPEIIDRKALREMMKDKEDHIELLKDLTIALAEQNKIELSNFLVNRLTQNSFNHKKWHITEVKSRLLPYLYRENRTSLFKDYKKDLFQLLNKSEESHLIELFIDRLIEIGKIEQAFQFIGNKLGPDYKESALYMAIHYLAERGKIKESLKRLKQYESVNKKSIYFQISKTYAEQGNKGKAYEFLKRTKDPEGYKNVINEKLIRSFVEKRESEKLLKFLKENSVGELTKRIISGQLHKIDHQHSREILSQLYDRCKFYIKYIKRRIQKDMKVSSFPDLNKNCRKKIQFIKKLAETKKDSFVDAIGGVKNLDWRTRNKLLEIAISSRLYRNDFHHALKLVGLIDTRAVSGKNLKYRSGINYAVQLAKGSFSNKRVNENLSNLLPYFLPEK